MFLVDELEFKKKKKKKEQDGLEKQFGMKTNITTVRLLCSRFLFFEPM